jgi:hypothetical protein
VLVITDDAELRTAVSALGARTARSPWLVARLARERLEAPSIGNRRPPPPAAGDANTATDDANPTPDDATDERRWRPGRGATTKRGNPRRSRRSSP